MQNVRVAAVQFEHASGNKQANFGKIEAFVRQAAGRGVNIAAFPECCLTGYWFLRKLSREQLWELAEEVPGGPSTKRLLEMAAQHRMTIAAGLVERTADGAMYNTYIVAMPDGQFRRHRKIQAFEHECISAGNEYTVFDTPHGVRLGVLICYDNNIIENARITALMGADILLSPHQTGGCCSVSPHGLKPIDRAIWDRRHEDPESIAREITGDKGRAWLMRWLPSRAHDNGMFLMFANGIGVDDDEIRTGNAMVLDPYGRIIVETSEAADAMVVADLDPALLHNCTGRRWMKTRRPELYTLLATRTGKEAPTRLVRFGKEG
ncbi:MAG: nitrilase family protein [Tepidisphaerales bacterium]